MRIFKNIGFMQGRLSPSKKKIQFFPEKSWEKEFYFAKKIGFRYMEWTLDYKNFHKNPIFSHHGLRRIKYLSKKFNIKIKTLTGDFIMQKPFWRYNDSSKYINDFKKVINACFELKIKYLIFPLVDSSSVKNLEEEKKIIYECKKMTNILHSKKVIILFESDYPPTKLKNFIKKFNLKFFAINYDTGNSASLNYDINEEFNNYGKFIKNIHIKDRLLYGKTVRLGKGNVNFKDLLSNIYKINYKNLIILQTARSVKKNDDFNELKKNYSFLKKKLDKFK